MTTARGSKRTSTKPKPWSSYTSVRKDCRACGETLETVLDLGVQQIVNLGDKEKRSAPLELTKCQSCNLVQLRHTVDREYLFRNYYYRSGATQTMREHLKGIVNEVQKRVKLEKEDIVVDIGSNDGTLLDCYPSETIRIGFEPSNIRESPTVGTVTVKTFFSAGKYFQLTPWVKNRAKVITAIAMFYDLDDPNAFLQDVKKVLAPDGLFVLQVNDFRQVLKNNAISDIVSEHLCYYTESTLGNLLHDNGFAIERVKFNDINGGSIRFFVRHRKSASGDQGSGDNLISADIQAFADRISTIARKTREHVELLRKMGRTVSVIGASTRGAALLQYAGLAPKYGLLLDCVERDPSKVGKRYLGMKIISEDEDRANPADWYLLTTNWFRDEIMKRMPHARRFLIPLPEPRIVVDGIETPL